MKCWEKELPDDQHNVIAKIYMIKKYPHNKNDLYFSNTKPNFSSRTTS